MGQVGASKVRWLSRQRRLLEKPDDPSSVPKILLIEGKT